MAKVLVIGEASAGEELGRDGPRRGLAVTFAESLGDGVRRLLEDRGVALVVIDGALLRLAPTQQAALFARVAPGVPVVVAAGPTLGGPTRLALERAGFTVRPRPLVLDDLAALLSGTAPC